MQEISTFAPSKINLFLDVLSKRPDGYHEIASIMAKIALGDDLKIAVEEAPEIKIELKVRGPFAQGLKEDKSNLVYKAAAAFFEYFNIKAHCQIRLEKNIPLASGLGGGSSDAAATLLALCALFGIELNSKRKKDLVKLAAKLGADIPFFLSKETFMLAEGIGEKLTPVKNNLKDDIFVVIANPNLPSPTKAAYDGIKLPKTKKSLTKNSKIAKLINEIEKGGSLKQLSPLIYNKLESSVFSYIKEVKDLKEKLQDYGVALMSGSGASVFALLDDKAKAEKIEATLKAEGYTVFVTRFWRASL